jgi:hypothetical protein
MKIVIDERAKRNIPNVILKKAEKESTLNRLALST